MGYANWGYKRGLIERTSNETLDELVDRLIASPVILIKTCDQKTSVELSTQLIV